MNTKLLGKCYSDNSYNSCKDVTATSRGLWRPANLLAAAMLLALPVSLQAQDSIVAGANVNMVSGTEFPGGDPFLQRQNEPSLAVSTRNPLHLLGGANDYRTVDVPGLTDGKAVGDSWHGVFTSINGGGSWVSTLIPGYEQDDSSTNPGDPNYSPLKGYEAGADPVVRAGTNGLFYYSGIVFDRGEGQKSAAFVSRFMDLNNTPSLREQGVAGSPEAFENGPVRYIDTVLVDSDPGEANDPSSQGFIDKPWLAVDIPRPAVSQTETIRVPQPAHPDGHIDQTVDCGPLYMAYAQILGEDSSNIDSKIMFASSYNCGRSWSTPIAIDGDDRTINQGTSVAINPTNGDVYIAWRQFSLATLKCTRGGDFWEQNPEVWPVEQFVLGGELYSKEQALGIYRHSGKGNPWVLSRELITAKLNTFAGADSSAIAEMIEEADAKLIEADWVYEGGPQTRKGNGNKGNSGNGNSGNGNSGNGNSGNGNNGNANEWDLLIQAMSDYNSGVTGPGNCADFEIGDGDPLAEDMEDAIMVVVCKQFGQNCSAPEEVSTLVPFDQGTTMYTFRANSYPTMTFDDAGRAYLAWSTRKLEGADSEFGDSRVVVSTYQQGDAGWSPAKPIDPRPVDSNAASAERGHQIQPTITFSRGKLILVYLDFRQDRSGVFERFIADYFVPGQEQDPNADPTEVPQYRHTVDVRAAQASPGTDPTFMSDESVLNSTQLSRYFNLLLQDPIAGPKREQIQYNPLNQPLFKGGTVPFIGDYIDVAAESTFVPDGNGGWRYDFGTTDSPVYHAVWADNRDVKAPPDGDWTSYVPPTSGGPSLFDPSQTVQACEMVPDGADRTGMRNQNIYTSRITNGIVAAIPENAKPLFPDATTSFVLLVKYSNNTLVQGADRKRDFNVTFGDLPAGMEASFDQFDFGPDKRSRTLSIGDNSSAVVTVFVTSDEPAAALDILVESSDGKLRSTARINPDPENPKPLFSQERFTPDLLRDGEVDSFWMPEFFDGNLQQREDGSFILFHDLDSDTPTLINDSGTTLSGSQLDYLNAALLQLSLSNPDVFNPGIYNPGIYNPGIYNPGIYNPGIYNPGIYNPGIYNPGIYNPGIYNPGIYNPGIYNPGIYNSTISDANYVVENDGDAAAAYNVNLRLDDLDQANFDYQLIVSKIYVTPVAEGCDIVGAPVQEVLVNNTNPVLGGNLLNVDSNDSFYLEPGEFGIVTVRAIPKEPEPGEPAPDPRTVFDDLSLSVIPDALDETDVINGETQPTPILEPSQQLEANPLEILTVAVDSAVAGQAYSFEITTEGGAGAQSWSIAAGSLPEGLSLVSGGLIAGVPLESGVFSFTARVVDATMIFEKTFEISVSAPDLVVTSLINSPTNPNDLQSVTFQLMIENLGDATADETTVTLSINGAEFNLAVPVLSSPMIEAGGEVGSTALVSFTTTGPLPAGSYAVEATVNSDGSLVESNYANNSLTRLISVNLAPDLTLTELIINPSSPISGEELRVDVTINNLGGATASNFDVAFAVDGELLEEVSVTGGMGAGSSLPISILKSEGFSSRMQPYVVSVTVDSGEDVFESDETNTSVTSFEVIDPLSIGSAYEVVNEPLISWDAANAAAPLHGYLATITSAEENELIRSLFESREFWIGGFKEAPVSEITQEPGEGWAWLNNEGCIPARLNADQEFNGCVGFSAWIGGEPSGVGQSEPHLAITQDGWNDEQNTGNIEGYIIEYSSVVDNSLVLASGERDSSYPNLVLSANGGLAARSWSVASGNFPPGLSLSSDGVISGMPLSAGYYQFALRVESGGFAAEKQASLVVFNNSDLPDAALYFNYYQNLGLGLPADQNWDFVSGLIPAGLVFSYGGPAELRGVAAGLGTYSFVASVDIKGTTYERELTTSIVALKPVINSVEPVSAGRAQPITLSGINFPASFYDNPDTEEFELFEMLFFEQNGNVYPMRYYAGGLQTQSLAQIPTDLVPGPATLRIGNPDYSELSDPIDITVLDQPSAPILKNVLEISDQAMLDVGSSFNFCGQEFLVGFPFPPAVEGVAEALTPGQFISVSAAGVSFPSSSPQSSIFGPQVVFEQNMDGNLSTASVSATCYFLDRSSGPASWYLALVVQVPSGDFVSGDMLISVNQTTFEGVSALSEKVTLPFTAPTN